jgi:KDO2-lipid IV(A) lauroyltransferase
MFVIRSALKIMIKKGIAHVGVFILLLLSLLPIQLLLIFARLLYYIVYYVIGYRKKVVRANLTNSFPKKTPAEILKIEKDFFKYLCDLIFEIIQLSSITEAELQKRVTFKGLEQLNAYFDRNESVLACTGHYGNWELGTLAMGLKLNCKTMVIYKPINNKIFEKWFLNFRTKYGNLFIAMRQTLRAIATHKNEATMLCFASDQSPTQHETAYFLPFLNQQTSALLGLEKIAKQTNRPIFYFKVSVVKRGYYQVDILPLCIEPAKTAEYEITNLQFSFLESIINEKPQYWLWSHRRWKLKP